MVNRHVCLLAGLVVAVHLLLLGTFFSTGGITGASSKNNAERSVKIAYRAATALPQPKIPALIAPKPTLQTPAQKTSVYTPSAAKPEPASSPLEVTPGYAAIPNLKLETFLDADALDEVATSTSAFELALTAALPGRFKSLVLEFLIDEKGRVVQASCIEGDCSADLVVKLQPLLAVPFGPAIKNGQSVASRKVIEVLPVPTFGL